MTSNVNDELAREIIRIIEEKKPKSVGELSKIVRARYSIDEKRIIEIISELQDQGRVKLENKPAFASRNLSSYLRTNEARWYWLTVGTATVATAVILAVGDSSPWL